jgi:hypothetical protein
MGLTGGCQCGTVRYELKSDPFDCGWCHCRTCQLTSGAPAMAFATVKRGEWIVTEGEQLVQRIRSSSFAERLFCGECGTPLAIDYDIQPETFDFTIATLDDQDVVRPGFHIFWASKVPWSDPGDDLPKFDRFRPDTVGVEGTEPPDA